MNPDGTPIDFDIQAAWLRRFHSDAHSNLKAFALRLQQSLPELVTLHESRLSLFGKREVTGVTIAIGDHEYTLQVTNGRLHATIGLVVRQIRLKTQQVDPSDWFAQLAAETGKTTDHARNLSQSLSAFMAT